MVWLRRGLFVGLGAGFLYLALSLGKANSTPIEVDYLFGEFTNVEEWLVLLLAFACGAGLMGLALVYKFAKSGLVQRRYRRRLAELEAEVHRLRNLPLSNEEAPRWEEDSKPRVEVLEEARSSSEMAHESYR